MKKKYKKYQQSFGIFFYAHAISETTIWYNPEKLGPNGISMNKLKSIASISIHD